MKVMKFGGTSVGKPERMHQVAALISAQKENKMVVLSALSGTTNALMEISVQLSIGYKAVAKQKIDDLEKYYQQFITNLVTTPAATTQAQQVIAEHFDFLNVILKISYSDALNKDILAQGELLSTKLFCVYLTEKNIQHTFLSALDFMCIDENEEPKLERINRRLSATLKNYPTETLFVTQGYICRNYRDEVDNLKRGGSDYTASLIASVLNASVCEIWTDIDGMHNNDPRVVDKTKPINVLSFDEAAELAYFGAKILHPTCIWPAQQSNVPVKLLNTMQPTATGTVIQQNAESVGVKAVAAKDGIIAIKIKSSRMLLAHGFLRKTFEIFEKYKTSIDMVTTSEVAVAVTIDNDTFIKEICEELQQFGSIEIEKKQTIVSIVGNEISKTPNVLQTLFNSIKTIPVTMVNYGGSQHNISLLIPSSYKKETLQLLNKGLFEL
jgi:aspartate kinase